MKTKQMQLITGHKSISQAIAQWKHQARSQQANLHRIAVSTLDHYFKHGDSVLMMRTFEAMPKSQRANKLLYWFTSFAGVEYVTKDENGKALEQPVFKKSKSFDAVEKELIVQRAIAEPFWKMKQKVDEDLSPEQSLAKIEAVIIAQLAKAMESGNVIDFDKLRAKAMAKVASKAKSKDMTGVEFYIQYGTTRPAMLQAQAI